MLGTFDFGNVFNDIIRNGTNSSFVNGGKSSYPKSEDYKDEDDVDYKPLYDELKRDFIQYKSRVSNTKEFERKSFKRDFTFKFLNDFVVYMVNVYKDKKNANGGNLPDEDYFILKKMNDFLDSIGVKPMEDPVGKKFDCDTMDAIMSVKDDLLEDGIVSKVFSNGFTLDGEVLLHQKVAVVD